MIIELMNIIKHPGLDSPLRDSVPIEVIQGQCYLGYSCIHSDKNLKRMITWKHVFAPQLVLLLKMSQKM